ncbi:MAG: YcxB family protein [Ferruginibacter sp.]
MVTPGEFRIENERGGRSWAWNEFSTWIESPYFFHLYFNSRSFFIVPKDAFTGEDGVFETRKIIKEKIPKK